MVVSRPVKVDNQAFQESSDLFLQAEEVSGELIVEATSKLIPRRITVLYVNQNNYMRIGKINDYWTVLTNHFEQPLMQKVLTEFYDKKSTRFASRQKLIYCYLPILESTNSPVQVKTATEYQLKDHCFYIARQFNTQHWQINPNQHPQSYGTQSEQFIRGLRVAFQVHLSANTYQTLQQANLELTDFIHWYQQNN